MIINRGSKGISKPEETIVTDLQMATGDQVILPTISTNVMTQVTISKPSTLISDNIRKNINIGGVIGTYGGTLGDPEYIYQITRPSDWLKMPTPEENTIYMLFHIPNNSNALISFKVVSENTYTVKLGTMVNNVFTPNETFTQTLATQSTYEAELHAYDWSDLTSDNKKQVMIQITASDNIMSWSVQPHTKYDGSNWNIMDMVVNAPLCSDINIGSTVTKYAMRQLQYYSQTGENWYVDMSNMFTNCSALLCIRSLYTNKATNMHGMFTGCCSLLALPDLVTSLVTDMGNMFQYCYVLLKSPDLDTSSVLTTSYMFSSCYGLKEIPTFDLSSATNTSNMFLSCYALTYVPTLDLSNSTNLTSMFAYCYSLNKINKLTIAQATTMLRTFNGCTALNSIELDSTVTTWSGADISFANCMLSASALVILFQSLPTISVSHTLTITGNPGSDELTPAEIAIATEKGWNVIQ